ncbi:ester cyclase [Micromonospora sp. CPCC 206061]|uniref:ester cyclase n=1 Tax=Micromonospora sp. CPCC 206061 TaxID=3122410 RepID=UPI002FEF2C56
MSVDELKKANAHFYDEVFRRRNVDALDELLADDFVEHIPGPGQSADRQGVKEFIGQILAAFPDLDFEIVREVAEGDTIASVLRFTGTHQNEFAGVPPTGRRVTVFVADVGRLREGRWTDHWGLVDFAGLMGQLGTTPAGSR